jgi:hypothetical protein
LRKDLEIKPDWEIPTFFFGEHHIIEPRLTAGIKCWMNQRVSPKFHGFSRGTFTKGANKMGGKSGIFRQGQLVNG